MSSFRDLRAFCGSFACGLRPFEGRRDQNEVVFIRTKDRLDIEMLPDPPADPAPDLKRPSRGWFDEMSREAIERRLAKLSQLYAASKALCPPKKTIVKATESPTAKSHRISRTTVAN